MLVGRLGGFPADAVGMGAAIRRRDGARLPPHLVGANDLRFIGDDINVAKMLGMAGRCGAHGRLRLPRLRGGAPRASSRPAGDWATWWPTQGEGYLLLVFASVFIGGTSVYGGSGTVWGTVIGSIMMGTIEAGNS